MKTSYTLFAALATAVYFLACTHEQQFDYMLEQTLDQPETTMLNLCFPNNDALSRIEMWCKSLFGFWATHGKFYFKVR